MMVMMQLLNLLIENLLLHPGELEPLLGDIVDVCFFHLLSKYKADCKDKGSALQGEEALEDSAAACRELILSVPLP